MSSIQVRPFRRRDRDQLTDLVNAHAAAVVPGQGVSVSALLSHLDRQPGEAIVDPWVSERLTLVAEQLDRVVAAAHLLRYFADERAGQAYRGTGEIHWLLFWPVAPIGNPCWPDATEAAGQLIAACIHQLDVWGVASQDAGGELPVRGVYGIPGQWPHISALYERAGFAHTGDTEVVHLAVVDELARTGPPPVPGLTVGRSVGMNGTRLSAVRDADVLGYVEIEVFDDGERLSRRGGWADIGNLRVAEPYRRRGVATWLLGQAAGWLRLAQVSRLLDYAPLDESGAGYRAFLTAAGFQELTQDQAWLDPDAAGRAVSRGWLDEAGLVTLPSGVRVRGRRLADPASPADFALVLAPGPVPAWLYRRIRWPDFWVPLDRADALDALREAHRRAHAGERVEAACRGGIGRTGTALAALAVLDGLSPQDALHWVRAGYHRAAIETPWQRHWLMNASWPS